MSKFLTFTKKYHISIGTFLLIGYLSLAKFSNLPEVPSVTWSDKIVHTLMYAFLAFVLRDDMGTRTQRTLWMAFVIALAFGGMMELAQAQTDYRSGDWRDMIANCLGAITGASLYLPISKIWRNLGLPKLKLFHQTLDTERI